VAYDGARGLIFVSETTANRIHLITMVDPSDRNTWRIAVLAGDGEGFADGTTGEARFRGPTGLFFDDTNRTLLVADTGNQVVRELDLGAPTATVRTIAGTPARFGFDGDGGPARSARLYRPEGITRCASGDLFVADTGNDRVRRIHGADHVIDTVLGNGTAASSGQGLPATMFPVNAPQGLGCDPFGNLYVTSTDSVRLVMADENHAVDGAGMVTTIFGAPPRTGFPESISRCLSGLSVRPPDRIWLTDSCAGILVELHRQARP
jgi:sugar lactone lactonase YvrE